MSLRSVLLIIISDGDCTGYELTKEFETVLGNFWTASHQQVYRELGKMHDDGLVERRVEPQDGKPDRKVYTITDAGRANLENWLRAPTSFAAVRNPLLVKVYAGLLLGPEALHGHVDAFRSRGEEAHARFSAIKDEHYEEPIDEMADWKKLAYLTLRFGMLRNEADQRWAKEAQDILSAMMAGEENSPEPNSNR